jgi:hypothetical protein
MLKAELRSLIYNVLPKYSEGSEYHKEVIDRAIEKVLNQLYNEAYLKNPLSLQRYTKRFGGVTAIPVALDAIAGIYYSLYPVSTKHPSRIVPVSIPDKSSGVRRISTLAQGEITFYPIDQREMDLIPSCAFNGTVSKIGYAVTQDRVEYLNMTVAIATAGVRMDVLVNFSDYDETDQILIPDVPSLENENFTDMVLKILGLIQPQDTVNDNIDKQTNNK